MAHRCAERKPPSLPSWCPPTAAAATPAEYLAALEDWAEREARGDGPWLLGQLSADTDGRRHPPAPAGDDLADPFDGAGLSTAAPTIKTADTTTTPDAEPPAPASAPRLPSMREVISTARRYVLAGARVDAAFEVFETRLRSESTSGAWSASGMIRAAALAAKADAVAGRRAKVRACMVGAAQVPTFVCSCCGGVKVGEPMTCNQRVCPRCVSKLRRSNQAKVHELLELVDERRGAAGAARWRFLTLTMPSQAEFLPMRRLLCKAWGQMLRSNVWQDNVGAAIAAFETTHTRRGWHVHVHAIVDAYLPRVVLAQTWARCAWRLLFAAAQNGGGPDLGGGQPLRESSRRVAAMLSRLAKRRRYTLATARTDPQQACAVARAESRGRGDGDAIELRDLLDDAVRLALPVATRRERTTARWQVRHLLRQVPLIAAQHVRGTAGTRAQIVNELSKYAAKDLGGAAAEDGSEWGIAGTPERLADFIDGAWRWRTLRSYGIAYDARLDERVQPFACDECGSEDIAFERTVILSPQQLAAHAAAKKRRRIEQRRQQPIEPPPPQPPPVVRLRPPGRDEVAAIEGQLGDLLRWWTEFGTLTKR